MARPSTFREGPQLIRRKHRVVVGVRFAGYAHDPLQFAFLRMVIFMLIDMLIFMFFFIFILVGPVLGKCQQRLLEPLFVKGPWQKQLWSSSSEDDSPSLYDPPLSSLVFKIMLSNITVRLKLSDFINTDYEESIMKMINKTHDDLSIVIFLHMWYNYNTLSL